MPELPEVEIARRNLVDWWEGESADRVEVDDAELIERGEPASVADAMGGEVDAVDRRGKYLIVRFADGRDVVLHFRMTGKIVPVESGGEEYARLSWHLPDVGWIAMLDKRRLGTARLFEPGELESFEPIAEMGPEPYGLSGADWRELLPGRRLLKTSLLDQEVIAGLGNIATSEIMWRMELAPRAKVADLSDDQFEELAEVVPDYLDAVIEQEMADRVEYVEEGAEVGAFKVYGREGGPCPRCGTSIARTDVGGRSTYNCPNCSDD